MAVAGTDLAVGLEVHMLSQPTTAPITVFHLEVSNL